jgi:hypothetical protein
MGWFVELRRSFSYSAGYNRGFQGLPFYSPWWADYDICTLAFVTGRNSAAHSQSLTP